MKSVGNIRHFFYFIIHSKKNKRTTAVVKKEAIKSLALASNVIIVIPLFLFSYHTNEKRNLLAVMNIDIVRGHFIHIVIVVQNAQLYNRINGDIYKY